MQHLPSLAYHQPSAAVAEVKCGSHDSDVPSSTNYCRPQRRRYLSFAEMHVVSAQADAEGSKLQGTTSSFDERAGLFRRLVNFLLGNG